MMNIVDTQADPAKAVKTVDLGLPQSTNKIYMLLCMGSNRLD